MPTLPVYYSQQNVQVRQAAPLMSGAEQGMEGVQNLANTVKDISQKWQTAQDVMQYTDAKAKYEVAVAEIQSRAAADPDFNNSQKYIGELEKAKENILPGVANGSVRGKLGLEMDYGNQIAGIKIGSDFQSKQIAYNKVQVKTNIDFLMQKKLQASTPAEAAQYEKEIKGLLAANVATGVMTYEEADKELKDSQKTAVQYEIYADLSTQESESMVLKDLQDPNGKYSYLEPKDRLRLVKESQDRIFQNNQTQKRMFNEERDKRTNNLITDVANRSVDLRRIEEEFSVPEEQGGVKRETLSSLKKVVIDGGADTLKRVVKEEAFAKDYYKAFDTILNADDRAKAKELIIKAWSDGNLSLEEGAYLDSVLSSTGKANPVGMAVRKAWRAISGYKNSTPQEAGLSLNEVIKRAREGIDPVRAANQVVYEDAVKRNPQILNIPESGQLFYDSDGSVKKIVVKDGELIVEDANVKGKAQK